TNHLDMRAKDVLLEALEAFSGTVIFVSHDRYFIDGLATRVLEVENGTVTMYEGGYEDYMRRKQALAAAAANDGARADDRETCSPQTAGLVAEEESDTTVYQGATSVVPQNGETRHGASATAAPANAHGRRMNPIKQKQMEDRCAFLEHEVP